MKIIKKTLPILFALLATSTTVFAASGATPRCKGFKFNMEVVNYNVQDCMPVKSVKGRGYCIYYGDYNDYNHERCTNFDGSYKLSLEKGTNDSASSVKVPHHAAMTYFIGYTTDGQPSHRISHLVFSYDNGRLSENCADVFGPDISCAITKAGDAKHPIYVLTISQNS